MTASGIEYRGFQIYPRPYQLREDGRWTTNATVMRLASAKVISASNRWDTEAEAIAASIDFAKRVIDGSVSNLSVADL